MMCFLLMFSLLVPLICPRGDVLAAALVRLNKTKASILVGKKVKLKLKGASIRSIQSKDQAIASAAKDGTVTGKKAGKTTIVVTGNNGNRYNCIITVENGLTKNSVYLTKGYDTKVALKGTEIDQILSDHPNVAEVTKKGKASFLISAKKKGSAIINVVGKDKGMYACIVKVESPKLSKTNLTL